jgi:hypothetical protein
MKLWERLLAVGIIALLIPVTLLGFVVVCGAAIIKTLIGSEQKDDPDFFV